MNAKLLLVKELHSECNLSYCKTREHAVFTTHPLVPPKKNTEQQLAQILELHLVTAELPDFCQASTRKLYLFLTLELRLVKKKKQKGQSFSVFVFLNQSNDPKVGSVYTDWLAKGYKICMKLNELMILKK